MPSGSPRGRPPSVPRTIACVVALLVGGPSGCSQLQRNWADRLTADRFTPRDRSAPAPPAGGPAADPYAARVGLDDPPSAPAWIPIGDHPAAASSPSAGDRPPPVVPVSAPIVSRVVPPDPSIPEPPPPIDAPAPEGPADALDAIEAQVDIGIARLASFRNYQVRLDRQERVRETLQAPEQVLLSVRTDPFAVRLEWPDGPSKGREVLYSEAECNGLMHVKLGKTLIPVPPMQLDPNSPIALANSRHPISEAGLLDILTRIKEQLGSARGDDPGVGRFALRGPLVPPEFDVSCVEILRETPRGEHWRLAVDEATGLPLLLEAADSGGQLLERYVFRDFRADLAELDGPDAFDPAARFGRPAGRLADARSD